MRTASRGGALLLAIVVMAGCDYVVVPPESSPDGPVASVGWSAVATAVEATPDGLRVDLTIQNRTGDWSTMIASAERPATLATPDGARTDCAEVVVGTGGHRLAPGFQMRGFLGGLKAEPEVETLHVLCADAAVTPGAVLTIDCDVWTGDYNYYDPDATKSSTSLSVELDGIATDLTYPVFEPVDGLLQPPDNEITGINDVVLTIADVERQATTIETAWQADNPGEYPTSLHIGDPPVIGSDGIVYGFYESPDLASVPITPPGESIEWTTDVDVPEDVTDLVMLLSVESKKQRLFVHYAIDLSDL